MISMAGPSANCVRVSDDGDIAKVNDDNEEQLAIVVGFEFG